MRHPPLAPARRSDVGVPLPDAVDDELGPLRERGVGTALAGSRTGSRVAIVTSPPSERGIGDQPTAHQLGQRVAATIAASASATVMPLVFGRPRAQSHDLHTKDPRLNDPDRHGKRGRKVQLQQRERGSG